MRSLRAGDTCVVVRFATPPPGMGATNRMARKIVHVGQMAEIIGAELQNGLSYAGVAVKLVPVVHHVPSRVNAAHLYNKTFQEGKVGEKKSVNLQILV